MHVKQGQKNHENLSSLTYQICQIKQQWCIHKILVSSLETERFKKYFGKDVLFLAESERRSLILLCLYSMKWQLAEAD